MIASLTTIPVIGVPLRSNFQDGMDSLLSIVQMPYGVPVATMGINSSYNAGIFACQILTLKYPYLREKIRIHKETLEQEVESEDREVKSR
jgi:5-(carboxyamino)imidazole ribonucleotide mutase